MTVNDPYETLKDNKKPPEGGSFVEKLMIQFINKFDASAPNLSTS